MGISEKILFQKRFLVANAIVTHYVGHGFGYPIMLVVHQSWPKHIFIIYILTIAACPQT